MKDKEIDAGRPGKCLTQTERLFSNIVKSSAKRHLLRPKDLYLYLTDFRGGSVRCVLEVSDYQQPLTGEPLRKPIIDTFTETFQVVKEGDEEKGLEELRKIHEDKEQRIRILGNLKYIWPKSNELQVSYEVIYQNQSINLSPNSRAYGCCHLFCEGVWSDAGEVAFNGNQVSIEGTPIFINDQEEFNRWTKNDAFPPIMSYFDPLKRTTSCPSFLDKQRKRYRDLVMAADKIIIIGLKLRLHNRHIWGSLEETDEHLVYCSGKSADQDFKKWNDQRRHESEITIFPGYFSDYFSDICNQLKT